MGLEIIAGDQVQGNTTGDRIMALFGIVGLIILIKWIEWYTSGTNIYYYYTKNGVERRERV